MIAPDGQGELSRAKELLCRVTGWLRREWLVTEIAF